MLQILWVFVNILLSVDFLGFKESAVVAVELTESMWSFSNDLGYPAGLMGEKLGTRCTLVIALLMVVSVYMLLWATQYSVHVYVTHQWLFYIYYFLLGEYESS